jgi:kynurenine formamidase
LFDIRAKSQHQTFPTSPIAQRRRFPLKIVDLSRELYHKTPSYPGHPPIIHGVWTTHAESLAASGGVHGLSSMFISMPDHAGTHIDAPRHFD